MRTVSVINLGRTDYKSCWDLQRHLLEKRASEAIGDTLLLTEHDHVYTIGKSGDDNHLLADGEELRSRDIPVYHNDRGGDITYHGPGQLVGYPILDLNNYYHDLHRYLRDIEEVVVRVLARYNISALRDARYTGVWVGNNKICAIGVKTSRWITMHGFALNVNTDLSFFERIVPCGIVGKGVISMERLTPAEVSVDNVLPMVAEEFGHVFGATMETGTLEQLTAESIGTVVHL